MSQTPNITPNNEADLQLTTGTPTDADIAFVNKTFDDLCNVFSCVKEEKEKRVNSINYYERAEAQSSLPTNLRLKLRVNTWPRNFNQDEIQANHLIELRTLDTALKSIASNRKNILKLDLIQINEQLAELESETYLSTLLLKQRESLHEHMELLEGADQRFIDFKYNYDETYLPKPLPIESDIEQYEEDDTHTNLSTDTPTAPTELTILRPRPADDVSSQLAKIRKLRPTNYQRQRVKAVISNASTTPQPTTTLNQQQPTTVPENDKSDANTVLQLKTVIADLQSKLNIPQDPRQVRYRPRGFPQHHYSRFNSPFHQQPQHQPPHHASHEHMMHSQSIPSNLHAQYHPNSNTHMQAYANPFHTQNTQYSNSSNGTNREAQFFPNPIPQAAYTPNQYYQHQNQY
jgi:hypothetical protein